MGKWSPAVLVLTLAVLAFADCPPQAPCYTEAGIVNGASFVAGSLAPNTLASIYGSNLAWTPRPLAAEDILGGRLPVRLGGVTVHVGAYQAPLYYVSPNQVRKWGLRTGDTVEGEVRAPKDGERYFAITRLTVRPGTTVIWVNEGNVAHTSTSDSEIWSSPLLSRGESYSRVFNEVGEFPYFCEPHPFMRGVVVVQED